MCSFKRTARPVAAFAGRHAMAQMLVEQRCVSGRDRDRGRGRSAKL